MSVDWGWVSVGETGAGEDPEEAGDGAEWREGATGGEVCSARRPPGPDAQERGGDPTGTQQVCVAVSTQHWVVCRGAVLVEYVDLWLSVTAVG